jgi:hypothetical protein
MAGMDSAKGVGQNPTGKRTLGFHSACACILISQPTIHSSLRKRPAWSSYCASLRFSAGPIYPSPKPSRTAGLSPFTSCAPSWDYRARSIQSLKASTRPRLCSRSSQEFWESRNRIGRLKQWWRASPSTTRRTKRASRPSLKSFWTMAHRRLSLHSARRQSSLLKIFTVRASPPHKDSSVERCS